MLRTLGIQILDAPADGVAVEHSDAAAESRHSVSQELDWVLRPQRVLLSVATVLLVILGGGGLSFEMDVKVVVVAVAAVNLAWNGSALLGREWRRALPRAGDLQIVIDLLLAFAAVAVVDAQSSPLAWILLLVPVIDAGGRYDQRGGLIAWVGVSLMYMVLVLASSSSDSVTQDLLQTGIQQSVAVLGVTISVSAITGRVRSRLEATELARLRAEARRQQLWIVSRAAQEMGATEGTDEVLTYAVSAAHALGFDRVDLSECSGEDWRLLNSAGDPSGLIPNDDPVLSRARQQSSTLSVGVSHASGDEVQAIHDLGYRQLAAVVARGGENWWIGFRACRQSADVQDSSAWESLEPLIAHTAVALANARSRAELAAWTRRLDHRAHHDELTGLPNRAYLMEHLRIDTGAGLAVLFLDLDGFKQVNDTLGHEAGDLVLSTVAQRLQAVIASGDLAVRLGGDEFVVVARNRDISGLEVLARSLIDEILQPIDVGSTMARVGTSIGIAPGRSTDVGEVSSLLARADAAMYKAKEEGHRVGAPLFRFADGRKSTKSV